jgi:dCTP deaminase
VLSDQDIQAAIDSGRLVVEPFDPKILRPAGLTLHLGDELLQPLPGPVIDFEGDEPKIEYEEHVASASQPLILEPLTFALGHTRERLTIGSELGLMIEGRSTLARVGVSVVQSAMIVDTGHEGRSITLEIFNAGPSPVALHGGMAIARAVVFELSSPSSKLYDRTSRYASQRSGVGRPLR